MNLYRVEDAEDGITTREKVGEEFRRLHRTEDSAQEAIDSTDWDEDWGDEPKLEVVKVDEYATEAEARAAGYEVVA